MIIIGADIVPTKTNEEAFSKGNVRSLIDKDLENLLDNASYRIFNLETPLTDNPNPIIKNGPNLMAPVSCAAGLGNLNINLVTLANNHINDQSEEGIITTIKTLESNGISHVGAGKNIHEASAPFFISINGRKYGVYACAEHEFSIANENHWGANPFDALESPDHVAEMKKKCDYAIVLYHGGKEQYRYPSPYLQKVCRKLVDKGADLVICQHSHCIGCIEQYSEGTIVYGQGNFIFDLIDNEFWNTSILIGINDDGSIEYFPIIKRDNHIQKASGECAKQIIDELTQRSQAIRETNNIETLYRSIAEKEIYNYIIDIKGINKKSILFRVINKFAPNRLKKAILKSYIDQRSIVVRNYIECEAHRELLLEGLQQYR